MSQILRDADTGGMSYYRIEGRGRSRAQHVAAARGTTQVIPEYIPRTKVEVIVRDDQIENLISLLKD